MSYSTEIFMRGILESFKIKYHFNKAILCDKQWEKIEQITILEF